MVQNSPFCRIGGNIWPFHGQCNTIGGNKYQNDEIKPGFFRQIAAEHPNFKGQEISEEFLHNFNLVYNRNQVSVSGTETKVQFLYRY